MRAARLTRTAVGLTEAFVVAALAMPSGRAGDTQRGTIRINGHEAVAGDVLVKFRRAPSSADIEQATDADEHEVLGGRGIRRIHSRSMDTAALIAALKARGDVEYAEPNYILHAVDVTPNDTYFTNLWGLNNTGQTIGGSVGTAGADIQAPAAWDITTGSADYVVGIIDTGILYTHADLAANVWSAPTAFTVTVGSTTITCAAGTHGFNAIKNTCDPLDDNDHGTHVAGTIGAVGNNGVGVTGVNWTASIMGLKFLDASGNGTTANAVKAIQFAVAAHGYFGDLANVRILSNSWGGGSYSQSLYDAINSAKSDNMLFVVAAGNDGANNDSTATYPANYALDNIVSVAATSNKDALASWSNYGKTTVELAAPGVYIYSTVKSGGYAYMSGTSMATPHVSGAAALVLAACGNLTASQLKSAIVDNVDLVSSLSTKVISGGRLNVYNAIQSCASAEPDFGLSASPASTSLSTTGSATFTVSTSAKSGYAGEITITPSIPAAGVTVSPASATVAAGDSATFALTASSATAGTYTLTFTGTDGTLTHTATSTVTLAAPGYTLSLSPTSLTVKRGSSGKVTVTSAITGGFSEVVALSASGYSTGVTAGFSPTSVTGAGSSTLTLTASRSATRTSVTVTVKGISGTTATTKTATFKLTVR
jgi:subtilisin family serine protease